MDDLRAGEAFQRLMDDYPEIVTVLDIGSGDGVHADVLMRCGKTVTTVSLHEPANIVGDYIEFAPPYEYDAIWASAVLEHAPNPGVFLRKCFTNLCDGGVLAITVPPLKHEIVGGHLTLWNAGLLLYNLIVAGFDCSAARVGIYGYNISVIVRKKPADLPSLAFDTGDIEKLAQFFPVPVKHGFDGRLRNINW